MPSPFRQSIDAILLACAGWFLFSVNDTLSKWLVGSYGPIQIMACAGTIGTVLCAGWIISRYGIDGFKTPKWKWYLARGIAQSISSFCAIKAVSTIPLADFYGIVFLTPMMTALLAALTLKEHIGVYRIGAIIAGFIGVLIIAGPSFGSHNVGYLFAFCGALSSTCSAIIIRKIGREPVLARYALFPFAVSALIYLPLCLHNGFIVPVNTLDLSMLLAFSPISLIGIIAYSSGFSRARETAVVAPFHYTQMIWGALFGFLIFHDVPSVNTLAGSMIIAAAGGMVIWREHVHHVQIAMTAAETPI